MPLFSSLVKLYPEQADFIPYKQKTGPAKAGPVRIFSQSVT